MFDVTGRNSAETSEGLKYFAAQSTIYLLYIFWSYFYFRVSIILLLLTNCPASRQHTLNQQSANPA